MGLLDYYRQFEGLSEEEVNAELRRKAAERRERALAQVDYNTDSVSGGIAVSFVGMMLTLIAALAVLKRLDHVWILVRRAAGYDQRKGIIGPIFAVTAVIGATIFTFWLLFIGGLGSGLVSKQS